MMALAMLFFFMYLHGDVTGEAAFGWWFFALVVGTLLELVPETPKATPQTEQFEEPANKPEDFWLGENQKLDG